MMVASEENKKTLVDSKSQVRSAIANIDIKFLEMMIDTGILAS